MKLKRLVATLLTVVVLMGLLPITALAAETKYVYFMKCPGGVSSVATLLGPHTFSVAQSSQTVPAECTLCGNKSGLTVEKGPVVVETNRYWTPNGLTDITPKAKLGDEKVCGTVYAYGDDKVFSKFVSDAMTYTDTTQYFWFSAIGGARTLKWSADDTYYLEPYILAGPDAGTYRAKLFATDSFAASTKPAFNVQTTAFISLTDNEPEKWLTDVNDNARAFTLSEAKEMARNYAVASLVSMYYAYRRKAPALGDDARSILNADLNECKIDIYHFTGDGNNNRNEDVYTTAVTLSEYAQKGILANQSQLKIAELVEEAFGSKVSKVFASPETADGVLLSDDERYALIFLLNYVMRPYPTDDLNTMRAKYGRFLMNAEGQKAMEEALANRVYQDNAGKSGDADLGTAMYMLQYMANLFSATSDEDLKGKTTDCIAWYDQLSLEGGTVPFLNDDDNKEADTLQGLAAYVYGNFTYNPDSIPEEFKGSTHRAGSDKKVLSDAAKMQPYILSAYDSLVRLNENGSGLDVQKQASLTNRMTYFTWRMYVTYGVMTGILDEGCLDAVALNTLDAKVLYSPPPRSMVGSSASTNNTYYLNRPGAWAYLTVYNEYRSVIITSTNFLGRALAGSEVSQSDLKTLLDAKDGVLDLYNMLQVFDDDAMWAVWNDKTVDENGKYCMADVYAFLIAQHAFDGSLDPNNDGKGMEVWSYFFKDSTLSDSMLTGIKQSATFLPMHTNVYDPATWSEVDTAWLLNYYAKFGYFRKALYIDTSADAAVTFANTNGRGQLAVATLDDLLRDKDIVLYLDDNLYNVNVLSELIGKAWDRLGQDSSTDGRNGIDKLGGLVTNLWEVSMPELAKTAERNTYSGRVSEEKANDPDDTWGGLFFSEEYSAEEQEQINKDSDQNADPAASTASPDPSASPAPSQAPEDSQDVIDDPDATGTVYKAPPRSESIFYYLWPDYVWDEVSDQQVSENGKVSRTTEYTPLFGFAVLSAIYKNDGLKESLNCTLSANTPVFISSATAPYVCSDLQTSIYNYMLLRNLEAQIPVDYAANLDMTSPLYMDIFGNILTESGLVVVPAAANATLWSTSYTPRNAAFFSCYGDTYRLPYVAGESGKGIHAMLTGSDPALCSVRKGESVYSLNALRTTDSTVNAAMLSTANQQALNDVADTWALFLKSKNAIAAPYSINLWKMIVTEVLRGAPIESIDKQFEGIQTDVNYTRNGLIIADKLETLCNAIAPAGQNASLAIPNPAFIDGIEIIVFFVYKLLILAVLIIWMVNVYLDATGGVIGWKTGAKCIGVVVLVLALIVGVPKVFELSYYESNKHLLQNETEYLLMLNTEKKANGQEIGVSKVRPPETSTVLYMHLADINMPWWDLLSKIGLSAGYKSLDEMYKDYTGMHPLAYSEYATTMNDGIYISIDQLFDSAGIQFSPLSKRIYITGSDNTPASYYTPYYWFLYSITESVADWSKANNAVAYTTKVQKGGELKTLGYCKLFFESPDFLEENGDYFHLYQVYDVWTERPDNTVIQQETLEQLRESQWCSYQNGQMSDKGYTDRINKLQTYAQEWIANNHDMIGRISDETFLKCFALSCAMEHNRLFNTQRADYLEIQQLSNEDLLRLSIADHNKVMSNSSMSYARFVYTTGGTIACYLAAILELVNLVSSWVKPACTLLVFCIACISIFVLKLILRKGNNSIMGYILTISLMCSVNVLGAAVTKLSMFLPNTGLTPSLCILLQVLVQIGYIFLQLKIVSFAMRDWRNIGYQQYEHQFNKLHLPGRSRANLSHNVLTPHGFTGYDELDRLNNRKLGRRIRK